ncbi:MAG: hypothetical protein IJT44_01865 [Clostridia bacterium]|nr:hypothetical protein [Clostridia bacterium]
MFDGTISRSVAFGAFRGGAFGVGAAVGGAAAGIVKGGIKAIAKGINHLTMDREALAIEQDWYDRINGVLANVFFS